MGNETLHTIFVLLGYTLLSIFLYTIIFFFLEKRPHKKTRKRVFMHYASPFGFFVSNLVLSSPYLQSSHILLFLLFIYYFIISLSIIYYLLFIIYYLLFKKYLTVNGLFFFFLAILFISIYLSPIAESMGASTLDINYFMYLVCLCVASFFAVIFVKAYHSFKNQKPENKDKPNEI